MNLKLPPEIAKYQIIILPIIVVLISTVLMILVVIPQISKILETGTSLDDTKSKIEFLDNKAATLSTINVSEYQQNLAKLTSALPYNNDIPNAITQVQILASDSRLQINALNFAGIGDKATSSDRFQINLEVEGEIESLKSFIENVKEAQRVMQITGLQLSGSTGGKFAISLTLLVFYQAQQEGIGSVDAPVELLTEEEKETLAKIIEKAPAVVTTGTAVKPTGQRGKANPFE